MAKEAYGQVKYDGFRLGGRKRSRHGMSHTPTYASWDSMLGRCTPGSAQNRNGSAYYGHVTVCERWKSFENFFADMGERPPGTSLDRIDNSKGYFPGNCRWATAKQQAHNTRFTRMVTFNGETKCLSEWSRITGIGYTVLRHRLLNMKLSPEEALTRPIDQDKARRAKGKA